MKGRCTRLIVFTIALTSITYATLVQADVMINTDKQMINQQKLPIVKTKETTIKIKPLIYNPYDLNVISNVRLFQLQKMFKGTKMQGLESYFIIAEKEYGINALFLVGLVVNESGWNNSKRANDGSNNLTGHAVYNSLSRGTTFSSKADCIYSTARLIKCDYLNKNGLYHKGNDIWSVNKSYSATNKWSKDINSIVYDLINKVNK